MKIKFISIITILLSLWSCNQSRTKEITYSNPLSVSFGDPYILAASDGRYYMYGTSGEKGFRAYSSDDLTDWKEEGLVYQGGTDQCMSGVANTICGIVPIGNKTLPTRKRTSGLALRWLINQPDLSKT